MNKKGVPHFVSYLLENALFLWVYLLIFRAVFAYFLLQEKAPAKAWMLGMRFDIKLVCIVLFPLVILVLLTRQKFFTKNIWKKISIWYLMFIYTVLFIFYITDAGYYQYLGTRLDSSILRFFNDDFGVTQHMKIIWESYPVLWFLGGIGCLFWAVRWVLKKKYDRFKNKYVVANRLKNMLFGTLTVLIFSFGIYNSVTHFPLRWSEAFFSKNAHINHFALNPVLYFFESKTADNNHFDLTETKKYFPAVAKHLNISKDTLKFERQVIFKDTQKPNVVFVMLESFGASVMSHFGNPISTTPKMDSIAAESLFFTNLFVHKVGTAPSVFASITGLPDVVSGTTASRTPTIINQRILFDQYDDYEKFFFIGCSANWANIRGVFASNIDGVKIYEEGSYKDENRADVWGIDDYELLKASDEILSRQQKPFIAYIETSSNHMPFTYPEKRETFRPLKKNEVGEALMKKSGFQSLKQLNALRYLDFNIGRFLKRTKKAGYYDNTIFVFFGDHNTRVNKFDFMEVDEYKLGIQMHHVPAFIHAPKFVTAQKYNDFAKLIDLFPTATTLARQSHTNYTLGVNLLDKKAGKNAFLYTELNGEPAVGVLKGGYYYLRSLPSDRVALYPLKNKHTTTTPPKKSIEKSMDSLARGFYESTRYLYFNNRK